ncbi:hypothetical protein FACS1894180_3510 [Bacteroidia bacterium]|nr:hypothetical protein FACS1894180_3510 [Bacteroidia bacterium]
MKKTLIIVALFLSIIFCSCGKDNDMLKVRILDKETSLPIENIKVEIQKRLRWNVLEKTMISYTDDSGCCYFDIGRHGGTVYALNGTHFSILVNEGFTNQNYYYAIESFSQINTASEVLIMLERFY